MKAITILSDVEATPLSSGMEYQKSEKSENESENEKTESKDEI